LLRGTTLFRPHLTMQASWTAASLSGAVTGEPGAAYRRRGFGAHLGEGLQYPPARPYTNRALSSPAAISTIFPSSKNCAYCIIRKNYCQEKIFGYFIVHSARLPLPTWIFRIKRHKKGSRPAKSGGILLMFRLRTALSSGRSRRFRHACGRNACRGWCRARAAPWS